MLTLVKQKRIFLKTEKQIAPERVKIIKTEKLVTLMIVILINIKKNENICIHFSIRNCLN